MLFHQQKAFSITELMISVGLGAIILYTGSKLLTTSADISTKAQKKGDSVVMQTQRKFSRKFIEIMKLSSVAQKYATLLVKYTQKCDDKSTVTDGPCFFTLNSAGERGEFDHKDKGVKVPRGSGINFFSDHILTTETPSKKPKLYRKEKFAGADAFLPKRARYASEVTKSKDKRYFVGWSVKTKGVANSFYVMALPSANTVSWTLDLEDVEEAKTKNSSNKYQANYSTLMKPAKAIASGDLSSYKTKYYLVVNSQNTSAHYVMKLSNLKSCGTDAAECEALIRTSLGVTTVTDKTRYESYYKATLSQCTTTLGCSSFFEDFKNSDNKTGRFGSSEFNFFFLEKFSNIVTLPTFTSDKFLQKASQNPRFFLMKAKKHVTKNTKTDYGTPSIL